MFSIVIFKGLRGQLVRKGFNLVRQIRQLKHISQNYNYHQNNKSSNLAKVWSHDLTQNKFYFFVVLIYQVKLASQTQPCFALFSDQPITRQAIGVKEVGSQWIGVCETFLQSLNFIIQHSYYYMSNYSYLFKLIIIGDTSVGKSCILLNFIQKKFKFDHDTTIGVEFGSKIINLASNAVKLQIWDTAGQETFKSITRSYYRGSIGVILVYDITNRESFSNISKWLDETKSYANDKITTFLVGNKSDLESKRSVSYDQGFNLARKNGMLFMECSAKSGQNIEGIFGQISETIVGKIERGQIDPKNESIGIKLGSMPNQVLKKKSCC